MVEQHWGSKAERLLLAYFKVEWVQKVNLVLYFVVEILLFVFLTLLPIKIVYSWLLVSIGHLYTILDSIVVVLFASHVYLYLNYKLGKLVRNPEIQKKLLFQNKVIKLKWMSLVTPELVYDLLCLIISIYEVVEDDNSVPARLLEILYLAKIYKIKIFHDRFQNYIIGTPFYIIYTIFYGLFILIILVSYVGCIFYQIDLILYHQDYEYPSLLWINQSAWNGIIDNGFGVQLLYAIYWSVGTASSCAYGDISASAPPDVLYNILCLYFEGFLFGFYLSRIHSLPATMISEENELLDLFQKFDEHNNEIKRHGEVVPKELYFKILCSIEYQYARNKSLAEIENILPEDYKVEIRTHIYKHFLELDPTRLWQQQETLRKAVSLHIVEVSAEAGEKLFDYPSIGTSDLAFLKEGTAQSWLELDRSRQFSQQHQPGTLLNVFGFLTDLKIEATVTSLTSYSLLYVLKRRDFSTTLSPSQAITFRTLSLETLSFKNPEIAQEPIGLYADSLRKAESDVLLMDPERQCRYLQSILSRKDSSRTQRRTFVHRSRVRSVRGVGGRRKGRVSVGVQCVQGLGIESDVVLLLQQ